MSDQLASMGGDTAADFDTAAGGVTLPPVVRPLHEVAGPLDPDELQTIDAWWRAANYLAVGQIYLLDNATGLDRANGPALRQLGCRAESPISPS